MWWCLGEKCNVVGCVVWCGVRSTFWFVVVVVVVVVVVGFVVDVTER